LIVFKNVVFEEDNTLACSNHGRLQAEVAKRKLNKM